MTEKPALIGVWGICKFALGLMAFNTLRACFHLPWRDEVEDWMMAGQASLPGLFHELHYGGHPPLWFLLLRVLHAFVQNPMAMQVLAACLASAGAAILISNPCWSRSQRVAWFFNYSIFFEDPLIARAYSLDLFWIGLLSWAVTASWSFWAVFAILGCMALTSVHGAILACGLVVYWVLRREKSVKFRGPLCLLLGALALSAWSVAPAPDMPYPRKLLFEWRTDYAIYVFDRLLLAFAPIPRFTLHFWDTIAPIEWNLSFAFALAAAIFVAIMHLFSRSRMALVSFLALFACFGLFSYLVYAGSLRNQVYLFWGACLLVMIDPALRESVKRSWVMNAILGLGAIAGASAYALSLQAPFSTGSLAARWIEEQKAICSGPVVADEDAPTSTVAAYLGEPLYYLSSGKTGSYTLFDSSRHRSVDERVSDLLLILKRSSSRCVRLVLSPDSSIGAALSHVPGVRGEGRKFGPAIVANEALSGFIITQEDRK